MDVGGWLRGLGLGQYEANFRDNKIDVDVLPRLTGDDLKEIGVSALGDRIRLLEAIAALAGAKPPADVAASASRSAPPEVPQVSAERRPITVMFCDLVGSTDHCGRARRRGLAQPGQRLPRRGVGGGDANGRPCRQEARRRADGACSAIRSRRRTTPNARCAPRSPSSARSPSSTRGTPARAARSSSPASASRAGRSSWMRPEKCSATRPISPRACRRWPSRARC